jgi:hypothetical protein
MRCCRTPESVRSSSPSLSKSSLPAGYTPGTSRKSASVLRPGRAPLNWQSTRKGLLKRINLFPRGFKTVHTHEELFPAFERLSPGSHAGESIPLKDALEVAGLDETDHRLESLQALEPGV